MSFKSEAKASRAGKHSAMGLGGHKAKTLDVGAGHTWDGQAGLSTEEKVNEAQRVPTRKAGGKIDGHAVKRRMDRAPRKSGGRVASSKHSDEAEDRKLIDKMVKPAARTGRASGGKVGKGKTNITIVVAPGGAGQPQSPAVPRPVPIPVPAASPPGAGAPPMAGMGPPPGSPAMGGMPPAPIMPRAAGGRVARYPGGGVGASPQLSGTPQPPASPSGPSDAPLSGAPWIGSPPATGPSSLGPPQFGDPNGRNMPMIGDITHPPGPVMGSDGRTMFNPLQMNYQQPLGFKRGGRVPHMEAGSGSGEGRLEKIEVQKKSGRRG